MVKQPQQVGKMAEFSSFVQQAQQCGRSEFSHPRSLSTQTCLAGLKKMKQGLKLLPTQFFFFFFFFYLSIVEVIQNERKANFVTLYDRNLSSKRVRYVYNVGSINDSRINVKKCASRNGLKLRSANTARSMRCNTAVQDRGRRLNQSHFRSMAEVFFFRKRTPGKEPLLAGNKKLCSVKYFPFFRKNAFVCISVQPRAARCRSQK